MLITLLVVGVCHLFLQFQVVIDWHMNARLAVTATREG
jgi:hypothetical protein